MTTPTPIPCLICQSPLSLRLAQGRKSAKPFLMLVCPQDGRHFRGFINDQTYVKQVLARLEGRLPPSWDRANLEDGIPTVLSHSNIDCDGSSL